MLWIQCGGCGGDTWSLFNAHSPFLNEIFELLDIRLLWHPSISNNNPRDQKKNIKSILSGDLSLDILCVEGSIVFGPNGTGMFDEMFGKPKKDFVMALCKKAKYVCAVGTCASYGGIGAEGEIEASGLQFRKNNPGGLVESSFVSKSGYPVINLPGCPCHYDVVTGVLSHIVSETTIELTDHNTPLDWYGIMVHQGCTRNEYHEYRVEEKKFGEKGCMFFYLGCRGPLVTGPCNKLLWNRRSSKTRVGVPCFGCTSPDFPQRYPFFETRNIEGIPLELPDGMSRAHYMAYKGMAAAAAPKRLLIRKTEI
jgi:hydrogenase small subunit